MAEPRQGMSAGVAILAVVPLVLLVGLIAWLFSDGAEGLFATDLPPVEAVDVMRHVLEGDVIHLDIVNSGPDPTTIAQVMVRGAFWYHEVTPTRELTPLQTARVTIPFPWNEGEPVEIVLLTSTGLTFDYGIEVATATPGITARALSRFAMLGIFVGVIPVALGLTWFPFLRRLGRSGLGFLIHLTVGLLAFLVVDAMFEGFEAARELPGIYQPQALLLLGFVGAWAFLSGIQLRSSSGHGASAGGAHLAWLVALGIGIHNLGEGLAIGSAYVLGELTLGALLVAGFTLHNATEGIAIVSPILREPDGQLARLIGLGALAGGPTILGCWIGAFTYSQVWALLFLGIGAGAIVQVIGAILGGRTLRETLAPVNLAGMLVGYLVMYGTGLLVGAA
ncbi:MAG: metal transporter [Acidobacteria bacterium]|nr:metal transporter [Acidobacteriota bacterium]NIM61734.1 metal transporter [Acidobacteriota bacterium]NIO58914.1 metal transporter [Acidobacteriota bacterium]NIQ29968.1 metal transporter [Acidobacteriota bacterium]NIQ84701.1 metal transporter [Acidobacteriota bacterium]